MIGTWDIWNIAVDFGQPVTRARDTNLLAAIPKELDSVVSTVWVNNPLRFFNYLLTLYFLFAPFNPSGMGKRERHISMPQGSSPLHSFLAVKDKIRRKSSMNRQVPIDNVAPTPPIRQCEENPLISSQDREEYEQFMFYADTEPLDIMEDVRQSILKNSNIESSDLPLAREPLAMELTTDAGNSTLVPSASTTPEFSGNLSNNSVSPKENSSSSNRPNTPPLPEKSLEVHQEEENRPPPQESGSNTNSTSYFNPDPLDMNRWNGYHPADVDKPSSRHSTKSSTTSFTSFNSEEKGTPESEDKETPSSSSSISQSSPDLAEGPAVEPLSSEPVGRSSAVIDSNIVSHKLGYRSILMFRLPLLLLR
jgi:hypothetical protein